MYSITSEHNVKQILDFFRHVVGEKVRSEKTGHVTKNLQEIDNNSATNLQQIYCKSTTNR